MPLSAFLLAKAFQLPRMEALGLVLVGSAPGGSTSNLFALWCGGDVALSVSMSTASTMAAFAFMPFCIYLYGSLALGVGAQVPYVQIVAALVLCVGPAAFGAYIRDTNKEYKACGKYVWEIMKAFGSAVGALFLVAALVVGVVSNQEMFTKAHPRIWFACLVMEPLGALLGLLISGAAGFPLKDRCTIALETGVQNSSLAIAIVTLSFDEGAERDVVLHAPLIYSFFYVIHSTWLVLLFRWFIMMDTRRATLVENKMASSTPHLEQPASDAL